MTEGIVVFVQTETVAMCAVPCAQYTTTRTRKKQNINNRWFRHHKHKNDDWRVIADGESRFLLKRFDADRERAYW